MFAILRRELSAYFSSPIGYIYLTVFYFFAGFFFASFNLQYAITDLSYVFSSMFTIVLFIIPVLTMRLLSEDNKNRTDQALLTAPVSLPGLVMGKFLSAVVVFVLGLSITGVYTLIVAFYTRPDYALIFGNYVALLLLGCALISIGMLISAMTENQVIAAVGGFAVSMFLMMVDSLASSIQAAWLATVIDKLSFYKRYAQFTNGIFDFSNVFFFLSVCAVFIFLTVRVLEKRRWS